MYKSFFSAIALFVLLSGCSSIDKRSISAGYQPSDGEGVVALRIKSNWDQSKKKWAGKLQLAFVGPVNDRFELNGAEEFKLSGLPEGKYQWKVMFQGQRYLDFTDDSFFSVKAGKINYIGDIFIDFSFGIFGAAGSVSVSSNVEQAKLSIASQKPSLENQYEFLEAITSIKIKSK